MLYAVQIYTDSNEGLIGWPKTVIPFEPEKLADYENDFLIFTDLELENYKRERESDFNNWVSTNIQPPKFVKLYNFLPNNYRIDTAKPPFDIDFSKASTPKLHRKSILVKGECRSEEWYESVNNGVFTNLVIKENHTYTRDALGFARKRNTIITYYNSDNTPNENTKTVYKEYDNLETIKEGIERRGNLVQNLQMPCIGLISIALTGSPNPTPAVIIEGRRFLFDYKKEFDAFVDESNKEIVQCFSNPANSKYASVSNYSWIDSVTPYGVTIRQFLIGELTI